MEGAILGDRSPGERLEREPAAYAHAVADHDASAYGASVAEDYDALYAAIPDTDRAVERLAQLAGPGPVLELGIGTGRLALPLVARGLEVHGIEGSAAMVDRLREKDRGAEVPVAVGDFAETSIDGSFSLVVLAINTVFALPSQDAQVRCFQNAARHLAPGGAFVVEAYVLDPELQRGDQLLRPRFTTDSRVELQLAQHDPATQTVRRTLIHLSEAGVRLVPVVDRYASPAELDLMARLAGLRLRDRWGGWGHEPFGAGSARHVSVYEPSG